MRDIIFPTRFSAQEMVRLKVEAKARGWSVGQLIRFRTLVEPQRRLQERREEQGVPDGV